MNRKWKGTVNEPLILFW